MNNSPEKIQSLKAELEQARAALATKSNALNAAKVKTLEIALRVRGVAA